MSDEWKINRLESGGIEGWVSLYKSHPMSPFAYCHEDEAEEIVALRNEISRLRGIDGMTKSEAYRAALAGEETK